MEEMAEKLTVIDSRPHHIRFLHSGAAPARNG
jgi:hypothetical protein